MSNIDPEGVVILATALDGIATSLDRVADAIRDERPAHEDMANGLEAIATSIREYMP